MTNLIDNLQLDNKKIILGIIICLVFAYIDYSFIISRQQAGIRTIQPKIVKLKKDIDKLHKDLAMVKDLKNKQPDGNQKKTLEIKKITSENEVVSLLETISDIAKKDSIQIIQIKSSKEDPFKKSKAVSADKFTPFFISLSLLCDYHHFGKFLNDLENSQILFSVENFKIISQQTNYMKQNIDLVLKTYVTK
jgi:Tfp pilus assembly protein PilO